MQEKQKCHFCFSGYSCSVLSLILFCSVISFLFSLFFILFFFKPLPLLLISPGQR